MYQQRKFTGKANEITLCLPCLTAVDGFSFPDLTCALARCREDASNWAAFIYNTSCSTCLGRGRRKSDYESKHLSWTNSSHGQAPLYNHNPPQEPAAAAAPDRSSQCNSTLPSLHKHSVTGWGCICSSRSRSSRDKLLSRRRFKEDRSFAGTGCPRSASFHKRQSVLFLQSHFLCPWNSLLWKENSSQGFLVFFFGFGFCGVFFSGSRQEAETALSYCSKFLIFLLTFHFVLGLIGSSEKRSTIDSPSVFPASTSVLPGQQEGMRAQIGQSCCTDFQA